MTGLYKVRFPRTGFANAGAILSLAAPSGLPSRLVGMRLTQSNKVSSEILTFAWGPLDVTPTGGSSLSVQAFPGSPSSSPFQGVSLAPIGGELAPTADEYFGWNLVSGEYGFTPPPKLELALRPSYAYALWLLDPPSSGGVQLAGTLTFAVDY